MTEPHNSLGDLIQFVYGEDGMDEYIVKARVNVWQCKLK